VIFFPGNFLWGVPWGNVSEKGWEVPSAFLNARGLNVLEVVEESGSSLSKILTY